MILSGLRIAAAGNSYWRQRSLKRKCSCSGGFSLWTCRWVLCWCCLSYFESNHFSAPRMFFQTVVHHVLLESKVQAEVLIDTFGNYHVEGSITDHSGWFSVASVVGSKTKKYLIPNFIIFRFPLQCMLFSFDLMPYIPFAQNDTGGLVILLMQVCSAWRFCEHCQQNGVYFQARTYSMFEGLA